MAHGTDGSSRRVEISGWDLTENFFVEKAMLSRYGDGSPRALLHTPLRVGALVFVRATDEPSAERTIPVTYQVATINGKYSSGGREVQLTQRYPRHAPVIEFSDFVIQEAAKN
ncbi:MAG TPA: hypothetical protein VNF00_01800 [Candidatus Acidoferrales bacterium]|nr:hypothetical protein [Candidatus Acidoferrales bacterium]